MDEDWQDAAFSSRHMHNRTGSRGSKSKHGAAFDVRKTFASYTVKCPAWHKVLNSTGGDASPDDDAVLELYRMTDSREAVVGELFLPGVLHAAVILAGSRDTLRRSVADIEPTGDSGAQGNGKDDEDEGDGSSNGSVTEPESPAQTRFETFEKNSFRSPKFWFRWCGGVPTTTTTPTTGTPATSKGGATKKFESDLGYIVFSGNDCRKFKGTMNCKALKWKNVAISGHKVVARSESDAQVRWGKEGVLV